MTRQEAYEANMERAHEALVEAKNCLHAASQQAGEDRREEVADVRAVATVAIATVAGIRFD